MGRGNLFDADELEQIRPHWIHSSGGVAPAQIAMPMIGGMISSTLLTLIVIPAIYGEPARHVSDAVTKPGGTSTSMRRYIILGCGPRQRHLTPLHS